MGLTPEQRRERRAEKRAADEATGVFRRKRGRLAAGHVWNEQTGTATLHPAAPRSSDNAGASQLTASAAGLVGDELRAWLSQHPPPRLDAFESREAWDADREPWVVLLTGAVLPPYGDNAARTAAWKAALHRAERGAMAKDALELLNLVRAAQRLRRQRAEVLHALRHKAVLPFWGCLSSLATAACAGENSPLLSVKWFPAARLCGHTVGGTQSPEKSASPCVSRAREMFMLCYVMRRAHDSPPAGHPSRDGWSLSPCFACTSRGIDRFAAHLPTNIVSDRHQHHARPAYTREAAARRVDVGRPRYTRGGARTRLLLASPPWRMARHVRALQRRHPTCRCRPPSSWHAHESAGGGRRGRSSVDTEGAARAADGGGTSLLRHSRGRRLGCRVVRTDCSHCCASWALTAARTSRRSD
jgi:hypothetical protein